MTKVRADKRGTVPYSRFQQWVDEGADYWGGVSLFNGIPGWEHLKSNLVRKESQYNRDKLYMMLKRVLANVTGVKPGSAQPRATSHELQAANTVTAPEQLEAQGSRLVAELGPEVPAEFTTRKWKGTPFIQLPPRLQELRIKAVEWYRERGVTHRNLAALNDDDREKACGRIVELSEMIDAHWAMEKRYTETGQLPVLPADEADRVKQLTHIQAKNTLKNQVGPQVSRLRAKLKKELPDAERISEELRLADLEHRKRLLEEHIKGFEHGAP